MLPRRYSLVVILSYDLDVLGLSAGFTPANKIAALMDDMARGVPEDDVKEQVLEVALDHQLVSKYTSLVAVDVTPSRPDGDRP